ncbi:bifunctional 4-hydroxy-2-oxoglutarate aldolase/2-dehydro-3-deoxy-phosphogluconate aldolase [Nocardioides bruguierae]|uniref:bifunctional 4-hydroxy-2-oxoglutarate aldolase/2-dehydro-3-deoxy-phosphogluconate aldolase n=1 Tax=Nocardioides bruguierae TaxID=2945102 RepID=UPI00202232AD|nr:bifunctional 4-hydroxy-2-oxoglutarate aldolase/2-dehydro-3-deoxy-phosphogluconate aldolase [Nocardioides bruguierae]MCL8024489.1 bifunctional 4-hydroxy-2-oxoglutarate aldolase/2-dehydro-3-deoxy-phosphogluconate aldolase [Nocardioides bruguierae]
MPVVVLDEPAAADDLGAALVAGGLPVAEVTLRSPRAAEVVHRLARRGDVHVGVGTVLTAAQVEAAHELGARFVVSPGLVPEVVHRCRELDLPVLPGVATAGEIAAALALGLDTVKLFPAEVVGGVPAVRAFSAVFGGLRFVPTGGITAASAPAYLAEPAVAAVGGSWMVAPDLLAAGEWDEVARRCAAAAVLGAPEACEAVPG